MKRILYSIFAVLVMSGSAFGQAFVQSCEAASSNGSATTVSCSFGSPIGAGHVLVLSVVTYYTPITGGSWSGDGDTFVADGAGVMTNGGSLYATTYYVQSTVGGASTFTFTTTAGVGYPAITIDEYSGVGLFERADAGNTNTSTTPTSNSVTTTHNGDLIVGVVGSLSAAGSIVAGAGYTLSAVSTFPSAQEYQTQTTSGPITASFTSNSAPWLAHVLVFQGSGGPPPLASPTFSPTPGTFPSFALPTVSLTPPSGATVCLTTDGSNPTAPTPGTCSGGTTTTYTAPFVVSSTETIKAISTQAGQGNSSVVSGTYTIRVPITWYADPTIGGTRYSSSNTAGQCNGQASTPYVSGVNQPCPYNDFRLMWTDPYAYANSAWVMSGGDALIVSGCTAAAPCFASGSVDSSVQGKFGWGIGPQINPPDVPSGTPAHPTIIEGSNFASCSATSSSPAYGIGPVGISWTSPDPAKTAYLYANTGAGGYGLFNVRGSQYVTFECLDMSAHGTNTAYGFVAGGDSPTNGNITLHNVNVHGFQSKNIWGSIGGPWTLNVVEDAFAGQTGVDLDPGDHAVSTGSFTASYLGLDWNGCRETYPYATAIPVGTGNCLDDNSGGQGDGWGSPTMAMNFSCDHCRAMFNTQDGFDAGHIQGSNCSITNSYAMGNMGGDWKCGPNATVTYTNNLAVHNCHRMSASIPGTPAGFNSNLSDFCRAQDQSSFNALVGTPLVAVIEHNTFVGYGNTTVLDGQCNYSPGSSAPNSNCTYTITFKDNLVLNYTWGGSTPQMWNAMLPTTEDYNIGYGLNANPWTGAHSLYSSPQLMSQPVGPITAETQLDNFNFALASSSPARGAGVALVGQTTDQAGQAWIAPSSMGGLEYLFAGGGGGIVISAGVIF